MPDVRTHHSILIDIESVSLELGRLASAVVLIGETAVANGIDRSDGGGVEVLGDVIGERVAHLHRLVAEGCELGRRS